MSIWIKEKRYLLPDLFPGVHKEKEREKKENQLWEVNVADIAAKEFETDFCKFLG